MADTDLPHLTSVEARVLGSLMEKKALTPDVYPLSLNALQAAANQKTSREPVMALDAADINRALKSLEEKELVRRVFGSRVERYDHLAARRFTMTVPQAALLALLLLRGPQTVAELLARSDRMAEFRSAEQVREELDMLASRRPPLVKEIGRAPGQREDRYAHLLSGDVDISAIAPPRMAATGHTHQNVSELESRVQALEAEIAALKARLDAVGA